jgi:hypothetical protein
MVANDIADGLKAALTPLAVAINGAAYEFIPSNPTPPSIWVYPEDVTYHPASTWAWKAQAIVSANVLDLAAQTTLRSMLDTTGSTSVKAAIEADPTLGGAADDVIVMSAAGFQVFEIPALGLVLGSTWELGVVGTG